MARIIKNGSNVVPVPTNVSVTKTGYVYLNVTTAWVSKVNGPGKRADHKKECIGKLVNPDANWKKDRRMYANETYHKLFPPADAQGEPGAKSTADYDEYPNKSDNIAVGLYAVVKQTAGEAGLIDILSDVFGGEESCLILDLAMYMLSAESAVFQHFPHWARNHALFSDTTRSDSFISHFEKEELSLSKINLFKKRWAIKVLGDGLVFVCYDSTNVNSGAEGIFIVEKGHAKDDPDKNQVNTEYAIRQSDGMPITFKNFPGSINDMAEAPEMIDFFDGLLHAENEDNIPGGSLPYLQLCVIADRGYVSEDNIKRLRAGGISYILMLKKNMSIVDDILGEHVKDVKKPGNYLPASGKFALTVQKKLFADDDEKSCFHIVWDAGLEVSHRRELTNDIQSKEGRLQKAAQRKTRLTEDELRNYEKYFNVQSHQDGTLEVNRRGRGSGKKKTVPSFIVDAYTRNEQVIEREHGHCGYIIYVSDKEMPASQAIQALAKRDCVEKVFRALKSWMGMNKISVHYESSVHAKSLIWFVASIIRSLVFTRTEKLRIKEKKRYTVPALLRLFEAITADKDLETGKYKRRYKFTKEQRNGASCFGITESDIDTIIDSLQ